MSETAEVVEQEEESGEQPEEQPVEQPDTGDDEPEAAAEPEAEQPSPAISEQELEKRMKQLDRSATSWRNSVSRIMEEDAQQLSPCPLCPDNLPGFVFADAIPAEHRQQVIEWLRGSDVPELQADPEAELCDVCAGHGNTLTGSLVPGNQTKMCGKCNGKGWTNKQERESWRMMNPPDQGTFPAPVTLAGSATSVDSTPAVDAWGRPQGVQHYGVDPKYLTPAQRNSDPWSPNEISATV